MLAMADSQDPLIPSSEQAGGIAEQPELPPRRVPRLRPRPDGELVHVPVPAAVTAVAAAASKIVLKSAAVEAAVHAPELTAAVETTRRVNEQLMAAALPSWQRALERTSALGVVGVAPIFKQFNFLDGLKSQVADVYAATNPLRGFHAQMQAALTPPPSWFSAAMPALTVPVFKPFGADLLATQQLQFNGLVGLAGLRQDLLGASQVVEAARRATELMFRPWATSIASLQNLTAGWAESFERLARSFGEALFAAIIAARDAALRGDREAVAYFFDRWAKLPSRGWDERVEAGTLALLEMDPTAYADDPLELLEEIQRRANEEYRTGWVPIGDTQLKGRKVISVEQLPGIAGAVGVPPEEFLPGQRSTEDRAMIRLNQIESARLAVLLGSLSPDEGRVLHAYRLDRCKSWAAAALACGLPEGKGENVRAKVRLLAKALTDIPSGPTSPFLA
jgi:hypothetical protein